MALCLSTKLDDGTWAWLTPTKVFSPRGFYYACKYCGEGVKHEWPPWRAKNLVIVCKECHDERARPIHVGNSHYVEDTDAYKPSWKGEYPE